MSGVFRDDELESLEPTPLGDLFTEILGHILRADGDLTALLEISWGLKSLSSVVDREMDRPRRAAERSH